MTQSTFSVAYAVERLARQGVVIAAMVDGVDQTQARWKPSPDDWSILEVVNHLYDEERDDFRTRFDLTLHRPEADWPPIHPSQWVIDRRYHERDLAQSVQAFLAEREKSLAWLRTLNDADLSVTHSHPQAGSMPAGEMLASWVAHDCLHIRQLTELHYSYLAQSAQPYAVYYAGDW